MTKEQHEAWLEHWADWAAKWAEDRPVFAEEFKAGFTAGVESERHISNMLIQEIRKVLPGPTMDGMDKWNHTQKQIHHILERHYSKYQKETIPESECSNSVTKRHKMVQPLKNQESLLKTYLANEADGEPYCVVCGIKGDTSDD